MPFISMRAAVDAAFSLTSKDANEPLLGRFLLEGSKDVSWLSYGQIGDRVSSMAALLDLLISRSEVASASSSAAPVVSKDGLRRFVAIMGTNSVERLETEFAATGIFIPTV
jgi:hypothetical protein